MEGLRNENIGRSTSPLREPQKAVPNTLEDDFSKRLVHKRELAEENYRLRRIVQQLIELLKRYAVELAFHQSTQHIPNGQAEIAKSKIAEKLAENPQISVDDFLEVFDLESLDLLQPLLKQMDAKNEKLESLLKEQRATFSALRARLNTLAEDQVRLDSQLTSKTSELLSVYQRGTFDESLGVYMVDREKEVIKKFVGTLQEENREIFERCESLQREIDELRHAFDEQQNFIEEFRENEDASQEKMRELISECESAEIRNIDQLHAIGELRKEIARKDGEIEILQQKCVELQIFGEKMGGSQKLDKKATKVNGFTLFENS